MLNNIFYLMIPKVYVKGKKIRVPWPQVCELTQGVGDTTMNLSAQLLCTICGVLYLP